MAKIIHSPNDKLFKQSMSDLRVARELFNEHLPAEIREIVDFNQISCEKNTFIDPDYKATEADVLYKARLVDSDEVAYLYLLCENQSKIDKNMPFRLLVYMTRILEMHLKQHPNSNLPIIYPMVIYTGEKHWGAPREIFPLFGEHEALAKNIFFSPFQLIDICRLQDNEIQKKQWSGLMEFVMKYRNVQDFARFLDVIMPWLFNLEKQGGIEFCRNVLRYVVDGVEADNEELFKQKAQSYLTDELRGEAMTLAQRFEEIGIQKGIEKGIEQGIEQGMQQGKIAIARKMLAEGMGVTTVTKLTDLPVEVVKRIQTH